MAEQLVAPSSETYALKLALGRLLYEFARTQPSPHAFLDHFFTKATEDVDLFVLNAPVGDAAELRANMKERLQAMRSTIKAGL